MFYRSLRKQTELLASEEKTCFGLHPAANERCLKWLSTRPGGETAAVLGRNLTPARLRMLSKTSLLEDVRASGVAHVLGCRMLVIIMCRVVALF